MRNQRRKVALTENEPTLVQAVSMFPEFMEHYWFPCPTNFFPTQFRLSDFRKNSLFDITVSNQFTPNG